MINIFYSDSKLIQPSTNSVFLAGPSPRGKVPDELNWRIEACRIFEHYEIKLKGNIDLYIPLPEYGSVLSYDHQVEWEEYYLERCAKIMFWIPRNDSTLLGLTTNFEFGEYYKSPRTIYGRPNDAYKVAYLDQKYRKHNPNKFIFDTLNNTIISTILELPNYLNNNKI